MPVYRGRFETDDSENPIILTAPVFESKRLAARAVQRAATYAGYEADRDSCSAVLEPELEDADESEGDA